MVPTLGRSPVLVECLEALRRQGGSELAVVVVAQGENVPELPSGLMDRLLTSSVPLGFSRATNLGAETLRSALVATVNDDAILEPGWLDALRECLLADDSVAAVQGANLTLHPAATLDGRGLTWNRWWQAVQIDHGVACNVGAGTDVPGPPCEVFGASATAALFRRRALVEVALPGGAFFDPGLLSYYEDVDLACRLRRAGHRALHLPMARARHAGSATAGIERLTLVYGNRYLVLARFLGRAFWPRLPLFLLRDALDAMAAAAGRRPATLRAIRRGLARALHHLRGYAHFGAPALPIPQVRRLARPLPLAEARRLPEVRK